MAHQKKVLVTGGAGFIGSQVNKMLLDAGYQTVVLDNLSRGFQEMVKKGTFVQGDLNDKESLKLLFKRYPIDSVMHFAAFTSVGESVQKPALYYQNNVANTLNLLEAMVEAGVKKLVFSSSAAVYGIPQKMPLAEDHPCNPINPYGETKWMVEKILKDFDRAYGLKFCALRYFNAAGGDPDGVLKQLKTDSSNLIPIILTCLNQIPQKPVTIFGTDYPTPDGTCIRDYIHVWDLGAAHIAALENLQKGESSNIYNLGNGSGYSVREVLTAAEKVTGLKIKVIEGDRRPGDPPVLIADSSRAQKELNWKPIYPFLDKIIEHAWKAVVISK